MDGLSKLDKTIAALDQIDRLDGDIAAVSDALRIPERELRDWLADEADLRRQHGLRRQRQVDRLAVDLQQDMLQRAQTILQRINDDALKKAPLNQLASAAGSLISYALKLAEAIEEIDAQEGKEQIIRFEYYYDGAVQDAPPWADRGDGQPRAFQGSGLRPALGQDRAGENGHNEARDLGGEARLVVDADLHDGGPGLA